MNMTTVAVFLHLSGYKSQLQYSTYSREFQESVEFQSLVDERKVETFFKKKCIRSTRLYFYGSPEVTRLYFR